MPGTHLANHLNRVIASSTALQLLRVSLEAARHEVGLASFYDDTKVHMDSFYTHHSIFG